MSPVKTQDIPWRFVSQTDAPDLKANSTIDYIKNRAVWPVSYITAGQGQGELGSHGLERPITCVASVVHCHTWTAFVTNSLPPSIAATLAKLGFA
jgi:hypothetical protein